MRPASVCFSWLLFASVGWCDIRLPAVFGDHMVLQREAPVPVWGWADEGEVVTVSVAGQTKSATAGADGRWMVKLDPLKPGGDPVELTVVGKNTRTLKDVLVGEVWIGSGQSNMEWHVEKAADAEKEIAAAKWPAIRLFTAEKTVADEPKDDVKGTWAACSPETIPAFSAVLYYFGRELHRTLDVPVGLIHSSWGGTPAESWTTKETLAANPDLRPVQERWAKRMEEYPAARAVWDEAVGKHKAAVAQAKADKKPEPPGPGWPPMGPDHPHQPSCLWNGMIHPLVPFAIRGVIWYQGENNADRAFQYRTLFPAMIQDWRKAWGAGNFPFLFVQLAAFHDPKPEPADATWAELREAQTMTLALPATGQASAIDIGDPKDIHPKNKQEVGRRLAIIALKNAYGKMDVVWSGPMFESAKFDGDRVRIAFKHVGGGLASKDGAAVKGFAIAGEDRKFVWADAAIDGPTVVVSSPKVAKPVAVRYAWADYPECNLMNKEGLPANPFRTDDWPGLTDKER